MKQKFIQLSFLLLAALTVKAQENYLITGTYTSGKSEGLYVYKFNSADGIAKEINHVKISNPSFVAVSADERFVYAVQEDASGNGIGGQVSAFSFNKLTGTLNFINQQPSGGDHPCYVSVDKTGKWVAVGNYTSGSLAILPVKVDGGLAVATTIIKHEGFGPDKARQASPHVHCTYFSADNHFLFVPDLGLDKVMIYAFDELTGKLTPAKQPFAKSVGGAGPRHICFNPNNKYAYLTEEMSGTVVAFKYKKGKLKPIQRVRSLTAGDTSHAGSADIHVAPDGKYLYSSNRADLNNIAIFSINAKNGKLTFITNQSTLGKTPRNFNFDPTGHFLLVANQNSDELVVFKRDTVTGLLTDYGNHIKVGNPVCLKWISAQ